MRRRALSLLLCATSSALRDGWVVGDVVLGPRRAAFEQICAAPGVAFGVAAVSARRLDALGPRPAWALAVRLACRRLERALAASARPHYLVDGDTVPAGLDGTAVPGGEASEMLRCPMRPCPVNQEICTYTLGIVIGRAH